MKHYRFFLNSVSQQIIFLRRHAKKSATHGRRCPTIGKDGDSIWEFSKKEWSGYFPTARSSASLFSCRGGGTIFSGMYPKVRERQCGWRWWTTYPAEYLLHRDSFYRFYSSPSSSIPVVCGTPSRHSSIETIFSALQNAVQQVDSHTHLYLFGSTVMFGTLEATSDMDCVALRREDLEGENERVADGKCENAARLKEREADLSFLLKLRDVLDTRFPAWNSYLKFFPVPVLRIRCGENNERKGSHNGGHEKEILPFPLLSIDVDISAHRVKSLRCTYLLREYMQQHIFARWLCLTVKSWGRQVGLHSKCKAYSPMGLLKSHAFVLMVVYFLLRRHEVPYIPPSTIDIASISPFPPPFSLTTSVYNSTRYHREFYVKNGIKKSVEEKERQAEQEWIKESQKQLWNDFFQFYTEEFDAERECIAIDGPSCSSFLPVSKAGSPVKGQLPHFPPQLKKDFPPSCNANTPWSILDPFSPGINLGEKISTKSARTLREQLMKSALQQKGDYH